MKKERFIIGLVALTLVMSLGTMAQASPEFGVGTFYNGCASATEFFECFDGALVSGGTFDSFALPASGETDAITLWARPSHPKINDYDLWLLAEPSIGSFTFVSDGGDINESSSAITSTVAFGSYVNPYQGINLGAVGDVDDWFALPAPFSPAGNMGLTGTLTYTGTDVVGDWLFMVSDSNGDPGLQGKEATGQGDHFTPKTVAAVGVPEPSTLSMALAGGIIFLLGMVARRRMTSQV